VTNYKALDQLKRTQENATQSHCETTYYSLLIKYNNYH